MVELLQAVLGAGEAVMFVRMVIAECERWTSDVDRFDPARILRQAEREAEEQIARLPEERARAMFRVVFRCKCGRHRWAGKWQRGAVPSGFVVDDDIT